jgi:hypothetical protein
VVKFDDLGVPIAFISYASLVGPDCDPQNVPFPSSCEDIRHILMISEQSLGHSKNAIRTKFGVKKISAPRNFLLVGEFPLYTPPYSLKTSGRNTCIAMTNSA